MDGWGWWEGFLDLFVWVVDVLMGFCDYADF